MVKRRESYEPRLDLSTVAAALRARGLARAEASVAAPAGRTGVLRTDSRKVGPGDVFLAYRGVASDGHAHLEAAAQKGAAMLVVEDERRLPAALRATPWVEVEDGRAAWAVLAAKAYGDPHDGLTMLGVTGTNGKTSTVWMTGQLLKAAGVPCLTVGTLGAYLDGEHVPTGHTTPDPDHLYGLLADARAHGVKVVAMEVSSHAIAQSKVLPIRYHAAAFTSFSRDHLDFHATMDEYFATKERLFTELAAPGARLALHAGLDREVAVPAALAGDAWVYGRDAAGRGRRTLQVEVVRTGFAGTELRLVTPEGVLAGKVPYFAEHALDNFAAAVLLSAKATGRFLEPALWARLAPVPGRLEQVTGRRPTSVVVDYAHTPDALEKTLAVLRPFCRGRLAVVFGCGGDRDRGKRPEMGAIAERLADAVYVTSDNPRSEEPEAILRDIAAGLARPERATLVADRAAAIGRAVAEAGADDMVLIAGKGHEAYQILRTGTVPFDDRLVAKAALERG